MKSEPVLIAMSILAGLQVLTAGAALADVIGASLAALLVLIVAAAQTGIQFYVRGAVTPNASVAAKVQEAKEYTFDEGGSFPPVDRTYTNDSGEPIEVVAGEGAEKVSDAVEGEEVKIERAE